MAFADWLAVSVDLCDHPKTVALQVALHDDLAEAYLLRLWSWAARVAVDGRLRGDSAETSVARACRWRGDSAEFLRALIDCGWVERDGGDLLIHDWMDHAGKFLKKAADERDRWRKRQTSKLRGDSAETPRELRHEKEKEKEKEKEIQKPSPASRAATDSQKVESKPSPEAVPPSKPRAQKQQKPHTPSAQEQIAQALAATRARIHPDLTPWPVAEARFIKVVNKVFAAGSDIRTAHDADPKTFQAAWERFLADPYWKANGGWPLTGFLAKWREHLDSVKATQPSASFRNAIRPGEAFPDPYAEEETDHG